MPSRISTTRAPSDAGEGLSVVRPRARSTIRSVTRSNDQRTSSSDSCDLEIDPAHRARDPGHRHVEQHLAAPTGDADLELVLVAERTEGQRRAPDRADRPALEADGERVVELDRCAGARRERRDVRGAEVRDEAHHQPEGVGELALTVASPGDRRVGPGLPTRKRHVRIAEVGGALGQEVAHDRGHLHHHVLHLADPVRALDEPARVLGDAHLVPGVAEDDMEAAVTGKAVDRPGVRRIDGEWFLGEDVDSRLECGLGLLRPKRTGAGQRHDVRPKVDHLAPVRGGVGESESGADRG